MVLSRGMAVRKTKLPAHVIVSSPSVDELPVTRRMLADVRTELLERIEKSEHTLRSEMRLMKKDLQGEIQSVRVELQGVKADTQAIKADILEVKADLHLVKAEIHGVKAEVARVAVLIEEQNVRNKVVFEALTAFMDRQERVEKRMDAVEETVRDLAASRRPARDE